MWILLDSNYLERSISDNTRDILIICGPQGWYHLVPLFIGWFDRKVSQSLMQATMTKSFATTQGEINVAEDGFDPSPSGLWAQHAPTAPLCLLFIKKKQLLSVLLM